MIETFGQDRHGADIHRIRLTGHGLNASILSYGAILQDLRFVDDGQSLVLGHDTAAEYLVDRNFLGAIVGRVANRIADGAVSINDTGYQLDQNEPGGHHLHGGADGTSQRNWHVLDHTPTAVTLRDVLPDGHMGYPGTLTVDAQFALLPRQTLGIEITATCDAPSLCNFAHHSYFNLGPRPTLAGHRLVVMADSYLPVDAQGIPTGEVRPVGGSIFDFRQGRVLDTATVYDHNLCLSNERRALRPVAQLFSPDSRTSLSLSTTEPGLQVYSGQHIAPNGPRQYGPGAGLALEPQGWPDAVNNDGFPSTLITPQTPYRQVSRFAFSRG